MITIDQIEKSSKVFSFMTCWWCEKHLWKWDMQKRARVREWEVLLIVILVKCSIDIHGQRYIWINCDFICCLILDVKKKCFLFISIQIRLIIIINWPLFHMHTHIRTHAPIQTNSNLLPISLLCIPAHSHIHSRFRFEFFRSNTYAYIVYSIINNCRVVYEI